MRLRLTTETGTTAHHRDWNYGSLQSQGLRLTTAGRGRWGPRLRRGRTAGGARGGAAAGRPRGPGSSRPRPRWRDTSWPWWTGTRWGTVLASGWLRMLRYPTNWNNDCNGPKSCRSEKNIHSVLKDSIIRIIWSILTSFWEKTNWRVDLEVVCHT